MGKANKLGFWVLTALVVGNMVGSGIFMLPRSLSEAAKPIWCHTLFLRFIS
ncbi:hypothetical protein QNH39_22320 [Neobacillus novalis]|uniref:Amino acid permease n=1 Tax=Neobacillus novalis TaxID=220687 RepID=A0AA95MW22_9BACI|nr:hypothetical protein [Neobacillus novalis]WHY89170.1 hypothetical protein QNH39_22320 [Neobacillus novalis]